MSTWSEDRKFVLEALKRIEANLDRLMEGHWKLYGKVAGLAALLGLLGGALAGLL